MKKIILVILLAFVNCTSQNESYNDDDDIENRTLTVTIEISGHGNSAPDHAMGIDLYHSKDSQEGWVDNKIIINDGVINIVPLPYKKTVKIEKYPEGGRIQLRGGFNGCVTVNNLDLYINGERVCRKSHISRTSDCSRSLYNLYCTYEY